MEKDTKSKTQRKRKEKGINALPYYHLESIFTFLSLKEVLILLKLTKHISISIKTSSIWEKYLIITKELKSKEKLSPNKENKIKQKTQQFKINNKYLLPGSINNIITSKFRAKSNPDQILSKFQIITSPQIDSKLDLNPVDYSKYSIEEYLKNEGWLIKKLSKIHNINQNESNFIFSGIIHNLLEISNIKNNNEIASRKKERQQKSSTGSISNFKFNLKEVIKEEIFKMSLVLTNYEMNSAIVYLSVALILFKNYSKLDLSYNKIEGKYMSNLAIALKYNSNNLAVLNLSNNNINDIGCKFLFKNLINNKKLIFLNLMSNEIGSVGVEYMTDFIKNTNSLSTFILQNNLLGPKGAKILCESVSLNKSIRALNISYNGISQEGVIHIAKMFEKNKKIISFHFGGNYICAQGTKILIEGMKNNKMITYLFLDWNEMHDEGAEYISDLISNNLSIFSIDLEKNFITDDGIEKIMKGISMRSKIANINLADNKITNKGLNIITDVLSSNKNLGNLNLSKNDFKNESASKCISDLIKTNNSITTLNLGYTNLGKNVIHLFNALKINKSIFSLILNENKIGLLSEEIVKSFNEMLYVNFTLTELYLDNNLLNDFDLQQICIGLSKNKGIKKISLKDNLLSDVSVDYLESAIRENKMISDVEIEGNNIDNNLIHRIHTAINVNKNMSRLRSHFKSQLHLNGIISDLAKKG